MEDYFYQRSTNDYFTSDDLTGPGPGIYFLQSFRLDKEYDVYDRQVYSISGVLQDVGGFYNSLFFLGLLIYSQVQGTLFFTSIISKLYLVEEPLKVDKELVEVKSKQ